MQGELTGLLLRSQADAHSFLIPRTDRKIPVCNRQQLNLELTGTSGFGCLPVPLECEIPHKGIDGNCATPVKAVPVVRL